MSGDGVAYIGTGIAFVFDERAPADLLALRERCAALGGALVLERATVEQKRAVGVWKTDRTDVTRVASELKRRFDPHDVLAPGRMPV